VPGLTGAGLSGNPNLDINSLLGMFGGLGTIMGNTPEVNTVPPEQLYASQLSRLQEMGFLDTQENVRALIAVGGNVNAAVNRLLGNLD
jgi:ubiquilin